MSPWPKFPNRKWPQVQSKQYLLILKELQNFWFLGNGGEWTHSPEQGGLQYDNNNIKIAPWPKLYFLMKETSGIRLKDPRWFPLIFISIKWAVTYFSPSPRGPSVVIITDHNTTICIQWKWNIRDKSQRPLMVFFYFLYITCKVSGDINNIPHHVFLKHKANTRLNPQVLLMLVFQNIGSQPSKDVR